MLKQSHRIQRDLGDLYQTTLTLCRLARVVAAEGRAGTAARLLSRSEALNEEIGASVRSGGTGGLRMNEETLTKIRASLDEAAFAEAWEQGQTLTVDEVAALALDSLD
jgi:hypothetical protein